MFHSHDRTFSVVDETETWKEIIQEIKIEEQGTLYTFIQT